MSATRTDRNPNGTTAAARATVRTLALTALAALLGTACWAQSQGGGANPGAGVGAGAGAGAPSSLELAGAGEPGTRLVVRGRVFAPDGETPAAGVTLYVYQTDAEGLYGRSGQVPRLRGWMTTDAEGGYEYRTIRPAPYPSGGIAAHVHTQLWGGAGEGGETGGGAGGWPKQWNRDLLFADDPDVSARDRRDSAAAGRFAWICAPESDAQGVLHCNHDLRLKPTGDHFPPMVDHGSIPKESPSGR